MKLFLLIVVFCVIRNISSFIYKIEPKTSCSINVNNNFGIIPPLLIKPKTTLFFNGSDTKGTIQFVTGQNVLLACPGGSNYIVIKGSGVKEVTASCLNDTIFTIDNKQYDFKNITCKQWPVHEEQAAGNCLSGKKLIKIGFKISTGFSEIMDICHDTALHNTIYTKFIMKPDAAGAQNGVARPDWKKGNLFVGVNPTNLYTRASQRITLANLLSSKELGEKYIHLTNDYFLAKGHLIAKSDYLYGTQQMATFWYANASPQWQTFNSANWNSLENDVRNFTGRLGVDLEVYTGTWGRSTLPDINGKEVELFLSVANGKQQMPVSRMYWKVLYYRAKQSGIAFIGLNNPYQSLESAIKDERCKDICPKITWLKWKQKDLIRGYSYCCEVNDFRKAFPDLPKFNVTSILS